MDASEIAPTNGNNFGQGQAQNDGSAVDRGSDCTLDRRVMTQKAPDLARSVLGSIPK
jgi:hypothetical protein